MQAITKLTVYNWAVLEPWNVDWENWAGDLTDCSFQGYFGLPKFEVFKTSAGFLMFDQLRLQSSVNYISNKLIIVGGVSVTHDFSYEIKYAIYCTLRI